MSILKIIGDISNILKIKKIEKDYLRVFFFENVFIENHITPYIFKNKLRDKTLILSIYSINSKKLKNLKIIRFNYFFFLEICFLILKIKYVYSSTPNLNFTNFRKSVLSKNKYIYIQHSPVSLTMIYSKNAFSAFDIVLTVSKFQKKEIIELNSIYQCKVKPWKSRYLFTDLNQSKNDQILKKILIAPTWGTNFFKDNFHLKIKKILEKSKYQFELRPHFMTYKKKEVLKNDLRKDFLLSEGKIDFNNYHTIITDWSGIFVEFSKATSSKCILLNIQTKKLNTDFNLISSIPTEIFSRNILSFEVDETNLNQINSLIEKVITEKKSYKSKIENFFKKNFY